MAKTVDSLFKTLEDWSPELFLLAGGILVIASSNYAVTYLVDSITFNSWIGLTVLLGRLASLLAVAGLTVRIVKRSPRLGKLSQGVVTLAIIFTTGLLLTAILSNVGVSNPLAPIFGFGTIMLSILTYLLFGIVILRTGAFSKLIGFLLLGATVGLLWGFFGQILLPQRLLGVIGTGAEGVLFVTHFGIGYWLLNGAEPLGPVEGVTDHAVEQ